MRKIFILFLLISTGMYSCTQVDSSIKFKEKPIIVGDGYVYTIIIPVTNDSGLPYRVDTCSIRGLKGSYSFRIDTPEQYDLAKFQFELISSEKIINKKVKIILSGIRVDEDILFDKIEKEFTLNPSVSGTPYQINGDINNSSLLFSSILISPLSVHIEGTTNSVIDDTEISLLFLNGDKIDLMSKTYCSTLEDNFSCTYQLPIMLDMEQVSALEINHIAYDISMVC